MVAALVSPTQRKSPPPFVFIRVHSRLDPLGCGSAALGNPWLNPFWLPLCRALCLLASIRVHSRLRLRCAGVSVVKAVLVVSPVHQDIRGQATVQPAGGTEAVPGPVANNSSRE